MVEIKKLTDGWVGTQKNLFIWIYLFYQKAEKL